ncbi:MAG: hypothetical protein QXD14_06885 [Sulfolobales archaeon]
MLGRRFLVAVVVAVAALVRLLPAVAVGHYFSTDVWPLIRIAYKIIEKPDLRFWNHTELGGYHNRWPASIISGVIYSELTGLDVAVFFRYTGVVAVSTCLTLFVYAVALRVSSVRRASICSLVFSAAPSFVVFTTTVLKEVYSYPIATALVLVAIRKPRSSILPTALALSTALVTSHPLTPVILASAMVSYLLTRLFGEDSPRLRREEALRVGAVSAVLVAAYAVYAAFYSWDGLKLKLEIYDVVALVAIATVVYGWYALNRGGRVRSSLLLVPIALVPAVFSSVDLLDTSTALYALVLGAMLLVLLFKRGGIPWSVVPDSILLPIAAATLYVFLAQPALLPLAHRVLNYVVWAVAMAPALVKSDSKLLDLLQLSILVAGIGIAANALLFGDSITYYWVYREAELDVLRIAPLLPTKVCGDAKIQYIMGPEVEVSAICGIELLRCSGGTDPLVLYVDNLRYGYVLSPVDRYPVRSFDRVKSSLNLLYSNLYLLVWGRA